MDGDRPLRVRELVASPALRDAALLAGEAGLDAVVVDAVLCMRLRDDGPPRHGDVVVFEASAIGEHRYQIDMAIRTIAEAGAVGLIITNPGFDLGEGVQRLANRFGVPLLALADTDAMALTLRLRAQLWAADVEQAASVASLLDSLSQRRLTTVESVLDVIADLSAARVCLIGQDRSLVAGDAIEIGERRLSSGGVYLVDHASDAALHSTEIVLAPGEGADYWLVGESLGSEGGQRLLRSLLQIGAWYLTALLASVRVRAESDARRRIAVLNELLATSDLHEHDIQNQMLALGWSPAGWNTGLHIKLQGADTARIIDLHAEVRERLREAGLDGPLVERNDGWSGWVTESAEPAVESYASIVQRLGDVLEEFVSVHSGLQAHAGIGRPYPNLRGLRTSLTEAHEAALIANARSDALSAAAHIDQLGVQRVLMGWFSSEDFARYARSILEPILDLDDDHELLRTLEVYLDASCSITDTAQRLLVHRNTVPNRIRRIVEVLGVNLDDPETRLSLQLACRVLRINRHPDRTMQNALL